MDASSHAAIETLSAYADGELDPAEGLRVRAHLDACASCSARVADFIGISASLRTGQSGFPEHALVSAFLDDEMPADERRAASAHLAACPECRVRLDGFRSAEAALRSLPMVAPSARTDLFIAALLRQSSDERRPRIAFGWAMPRAAIAAFAVLAVLLSGLRLPAGEVAQLPPEGALVASVQQAVFNAKTNTLYRLDPDRGDVAAIDATTNVEQTRISVGGRPTALTLSAALNKLFVLDGGQKRLTEIDMASNTVVSAASIDVDGTPTSLRLDPQGRIVVSSVLAPASAASGATAAPSLGQVTVLDGETKKVESVKTVDVAPRSVVFDSNGKRALLVSADSTTLADAATYRSVERLPGGIAAAFDLSGSHIGILGSRQGAAELFVYGDASSTSVSLTGLPVSVIALPDGGFAVLLQASGGTARIAIVGSDGSLRTTLDVALSGRELTFDAATARFAVIGGSGVAYVAAVAPSDVAVKSDKSAAPSASVPSSTTPAPSPSPSPAPSSSPAPSPQQSAQPSVVAGVPAAAQLAWTGVYRLQLPPGRDPVRIAGSGARIWFVDQAQTLAWIDTTTGAITNAMKLPAGWMTGDLVVGDRFVVAIDSTTGRLAVWDKTLERSDVFDFAFAQGARSFALAPDDRLWMAAPQSGTLIAFDVRSRRAQAVDTGASGISAISIDTGGRVSYADSNRKILGVYDGGTHKLTELPIARSGRVTSLLTDGAGSRWAGTDIGELIVVQADGRIRASSVAAAIQSLAVDANGGVWFAGSAVGGAVVGPTSDARKVQTMPAGFTGLSFGSAGSAWAADGQSGAFYIVKADR